MMQILVMTDADAIRNLVARYFMYLDDRNYDAWAALLADDCAIHVYGRVVVGREQNSEFIAAGQIPGQHGRHLACNTLVEVDGDTASAISDYFYLARMGPPKHERFEVLDFGRYYDRLVRIDRGWLFSERRIDVELHPLDPRPVQP